MSWTNDAALAAFIARKAGIVAALERIRAASDDHFFTSLDDVNWGHVTALAEHVESSSGSPTPSTARTNTPRHRSRG